MAKSRLQAASLAAVLVVVFVVGNISGKISGNTRAVSLEESSLMGRAAGFRRGREILARGGQDTLRQGLWVLPDNGVVTTINTRGEINDGGAISYNPNFVYGPNGSPVIQPDPVRDMPWRYSDAGDPRDYKVVTAATNGGDTPDYELINTGPWESDGSEWGVRPQGNTPVYGYFPKQLYPGSHGYNYPGSVPSPAVGKAAWMAANAGQMVEPSHVGIDMPSQAFYS